MNRLQTLLEPGEALLWEGRPAPRCYTFRNWKHSLFGVLLLLFSLIWLYWGVELGRNYRSPLPVLVPTPFIALGLYLSAGHLIRSRLRWEGIYYGLTQRRLLIQDGKRHKELPLGKIRYLRMDPFSPQLGTIRLWGEAPAPLASLCCIEQPAGLIALLEPRMGAAPPSQPPPESV